jgi:mRNA interferase MazF
MAASVKTSIDIQQPLLKQAEILAKHLNISQSHLFQMALEQFIEKHQSQLQFENMSPLHQDQLDLSEPSRMSDPNTQTTRMGEKPFVVNQGDIYWLQLEEERGALPDIRHPYVVVQEDIFNHSRIHTVVVCALTSNLKRATFPGNVLLEVDEANLPTQSIVEVSKVSTVDKAQLGEYIGSLSEQRIHQILAGMRFLHVSFLQVHMNAPQRNVPG